MFNNPRYEFDLQEIDNLKLRITVIKDEFSKCLSLIRDDNLRWLMRMLKTNYDDQIKDVLRNAERNLTTIKNIKIKFDQPINDILEQMNTQEFNFTSEIKKNQLEIDEQRQIIDDLKGKLNNFKENKNEPKIVLFKNEK